MKIREVLTLATKRLKLKKINSAQLDAEVLLSHIFENNRTWLFAHMDKNISESDYIKFNLDISRREKHEPIAYITGHKEFFGLDFLVYSGILIPRPETELLVEKVSDFIKHPRQNLKIADIGTGSGCIAISLSLCNAVSKIYAIDSSPKALTLAKKNAKKNKAKNIKFFQGDLLNPILNKKIDIVVANLPYLTELQYKNLAPDLKFEPKKALVSGKTGLESYQKFFKQISALKSRPKKIFIEINPNQVRKIKSVTKTLKPKSILIHKDLANRNRVIEITLPIL